MSDIKPIDSEKPPKSRSKIGQWFFDLWTKFNNFLHNQFTGIFDKGKIFYTLVFLCGAIVIAFMSLGKNAVGDGVKVATNVITLTLVLGFLFLMICAFIPSLSKHLFDKEAVFTKSIITVISFIFALIISLIWGIYGDDPTWTFQVLRYSQLLPYIFIFIFLGWNILQIHFLKDGIDSVSNKLENKLIVERVDPKKKSIAAISFLVLSLIIPILAHSITVWAFWINSQQFIAWVVIIGILFLGLDAWQIWLFIRAKRYGKMNVYSSFFYLLISLIIWFRSYGFITSYVSAIATSGSNFFNALGNILLVILTAIFVLKMIATRVKKSGKMNIDAIPFLVFAFTIMYIAGQVVMILGSVSDTSDPNTVNLINNTILLISSITYHIWYSQYILQRKEYIKRNSYTIEEIKGVLSEFAEKTKESIPTEAENIDNSFKDIIEKHKIEE